MDELKELRELVCKLERTYGEEEQIKILQEINKLLLTEYVIKIDDTIIEPLLVEAYYFHKEKFEDRNTHEAKYKTCQKLKLQRNRFGQLYFHHNSDTIGVDVCLSKGDDYCLSFLIKNSLVQGHERFLTQQKLPTFLIQESGYSRNDLQQRKNVLKKKNRPAKIFHTIRKGLTDGSFKDAPIASVPIGEIKNKTYKFTLGKSKTDIICEYIKSKKPFDPKEEAKLRELASGLIDWKKIEEK